MKINKIVLNNIGSYEGLCEFDFIINDPTKNVILIGGQNGAGKTSLFTSIKLALYGPLCFNYQGTNHVYLNKIRSLINSNAYTKQNVEASIVINFSLLEEREICNYNIERSWRYIDKRLVEGLKINKNEQVLNNEEVTFFQNYIQTVLPPHLLDFYFFDGEELATFFSGTGSNSYVKDALLTLCDFDTFEHIRKYASNYIKRNYNDDKVEAIQNNYDDHIDLINSAKEEIHTIEKDLLKINAELEDIKVKKYELDVSYKKSGGLSEVEIEELEKKLKYHENIKQQESYKLRNFVEELMPFMIVQDMCTPIKNQLHKEDQLSQYNIIMKKLDYSFISSVIEKELAENKLTIKDSNGKDSKNNFISTLHYCLKNQLKPQFPLEDFILKHDFSSEVKAKIDSLINSLETFNIDSILDSINIKNESLKVTIQINQQLRSSLPQEDLEKFKTLFEQFNQLEIDLNSNKIIKEYELQEKIGKLEVLELERKELYNVLRNSTQDKNIYDITNSISNMLEKFIIDISQNKFNDIKSNFLSIFKEIIRKDNFIDDIEIDENFNIYLFRKSNSTIYELGHLLNNVGLDEFKGILGKKSIDILLDALSINDIKLLKDTLDSNVWNKSLEIYKKVNVNQLSKGEKQIYILALYWAMIKASSHDIPFIIDTPYARIDTAHREKITTSYFPQISSQVIILSTDEEINEYYYSKLKPFISHEYLLDYDKTNGRTTVKNKYFFEV